MPEIPNDPPPAAPPAVAAAPSTGPLPPERPPSRTDDEFVLRVMDTMSLEERVGQLIMVGLPPSRGGGALVEPEGAALEYLRDLGVGGVILFGDNLQSRDQVERLVEGIQRAVRMPVIIGIDQEGGEVSRLAAAPALNATPIPSAALVGQTGDPRLAEDLATVVGRELAALGITMNFAPVADLRVRPDNTVTRSRAYGSDPTVVSSMVTATVRGLQRQNVSAVVKHFPGHGATSVDTHDAPATLDVDVTRLRRDHLAPFRAAIRAGSDGVMIGHLSVPGITGSTVPASLSAELTTDLLRGELGFEGVVVTDSLIMNAVAGAGQTDRVPVRAILAGADILLMPSNATAARNAIVEAIRRGELTERRLNASVARVLDLKRRRGLVGPAPDRSSRPYTVPERFTRPAETLGNAINRAVSERVFDQARP